ncbi:MAG: hypothetical protein GX448_08040 [Planctomycetes bacterium]|nr:hypothetical protein [Planctomycetota bacterium]
MIDHPEWSKQGDLHVWCAEFELLLHGDMCRAEEFLNNASKLGCLDMSAYHSIRGAVLCERGQRQAGIEELRKSISLEPSDSNVASLMREDTSECASVCEEILRENASHCMAHVCLAYAAAQAGDKAKAMSLARRARQLAHSAIEFFGVGCLLHALEESHDAVEACLEAERLGYEAKGIVYAAVAACYSDMQDDAAAKQYLSRAMQHNAEDEYVREIRDVWEGGAAREC